MYVTALDLPVHALSGTGAYGGLAQLAEDDTAYARVPLRSLAAAAVGALTAPELAQL